MISPFLRTFLALYIAVFMSSLGIGILAPILPAYIDQYAVSALVLGVIFGSYSAARTLFMPVVGRLSDNYGRRGFILSGLLLFTCVSPLYVLASSPAALIAVRFIHGIAGAMLVPVAMSAIGDLSPPGREGFIMGSFTSAFFGGLGIGPLIGGFMRDHYSIQWAFYGMGIMSLAALLFTVLFLPPDAPRGSHDDAKRSETSKRYKYLLADPAMAGLFIFRFARAVGIGFTWVILPLLAVKELGISAFQVGILLSVNTTITTVLQSPMGHLSDKLGHHKMLTAGSFVVFAAMFWTGWSGTFMELLVISAALGLGGAFIVPSGSALAIQLGRDRGMGAVMGLYNSALSLGTMVGPVLGGGLLDLAGMKAVFSGGALIGIAGWTLLMLLYPKNTVVCDP